MSLNIPFRILKTKMFPLCPHCIREYRDVIACPPLEYMTTKNIGYPACIANGRVCKLEDVVYHCPNSKDPSFLVVSVLGFRGVALTGTRTNVPIPWILDKIFCPHLNQSETYSIFLFAPFSLPVFTKYMVLHCVVVSPTCQTNLNIVAIVMSH